ncbi:MAG TPA: hypothetical protein VIV40_32725 [Kofleriaceae bacterium]
MAARTPRRSFATPFVVTLAAAPACYVQPSPGPQGPPPPPPPTQTAEPQPPPPVVANPPRPQTEPAQPAPQRPRPIEVANPRPPTTTQGPATPPPTTKPPAEPARWTVFKSQDGCMAAIKVECQPKATCNPPPPFKYACPEGVQLDKPITVAT